MKDIESKNYQNAVDVIKTAILQSQARAAKAVNQEQLALYYSIGKYVSDNSREGTWGTGAIETISQTLQKELPGLRGFSPSSIKNMRQFYEQWSMLTNRQPTAVELQPSDNEGIINTTLLLDINRQPMAGDLDLMDFFAISFTHHMDILAKTKTIDERLPGENPSVGIILCKDADKAYVEYVLQDYNKPMGVATYKATQERLRELLPPEEEMKRLIFPEE